MKFLNIYNKDFISMWKEIRHYFPRKTLVLVTMKHLDSVCHQGEPVILSHGTFHRITRTSASVQALHPSVTEVKHICCIILWIWQNTQMTFWGNTCCFLLLFFLCHYFLLLTWTHNSEIKSTFDSVSDHALQLIGQRRWSAYRLRLALILFINSSFLTFLHYSFHWFLCS